MTSYPAPTGYAPSYSWIGAPTAFNGTNPLSGGDSCQSTFHLLNSITPNILFPPPSFLRAHPSCSDIRTMQVADTRSSGGKSKSMVHHWRPRVHYRRFSHGSGHDTRPGVSLLGVGEEEIRPDYALGYHGLLLRYPFSMVLLGLFAGIFCARNKRFHWRPEALWLDQYPRCAESWVAVDS